MNDYNKIQISPISFDIVTTAGSGSYAYMIALFSGSKMNVENFISNSYINCYFDTCYFDIYEQDYNFVDKKVFLIEHCPIVTYQLNEHFDKAIKYMFDKISKGYILNVKLRNNLSAVLGVDSDNKEFDNNCVVYGIDMLKSTLNIASLHNEKFITYTMSFQEFLVAVNKLENDTVEFAFKKVNLSYPNLIDVNNIASDFNDYINSKNRKSYFHETRIFGINSLNAMKTYIDSLCERMINGENLELPVGNIKVLYDHKLLMYMRLIHLELTGILTPKKWAWQYSCNNISSKKLIELSEQFNKNPSVWLKDKISELFDCVFDTEQLVLTSLCESGFDI